MNRDRVQKRDPVHRTGPPPGSDPSRPRDSKPGSSTHTQHSSVRRRRYRSRSQRTHKPTHGSSTAAMDGYARAEDESFPPRLVSLTWEDPLEQVGTGASTHRDTNGFGRSGIRTRGLVCIRLAGG